MGGGTGGEEVWEINFKVNMGGTGRVINRRLKSRCGLGWRGLKRRKTKVMCFIKPGNRSKGGRRKRHWRGGKGRRGSQKEGDRASVDCKTAEGQEGRVFNRRDGVMRRFLGEAQSKRGNTERGDHWRCLTGRGDTNSETWP